VDSAFVALMFAGTAVLVCGCLALVVLVVVPRGQLHQRLVNLSFRAIGVGLGSAWIGFGLAFLTPLRAGPGSVLGLLITALGIIAISVSLLAGRPLR
jgi:hypothetical protein